MDILVFGLPVVRHVVLIVAGLLPVGADSPDDPAKPHGTCRRPHRLPRVTGGQAPL